MSTFRTFAELQASLEREATTDTPITTVSAQVAERLWAQHIAEGR